MAATPRLFVQDNLSGIGIRYQKIARNKERMIRRFLQQRHPLLMGDVEKIEAVSGGAMSDNYKVSGGGMPLLVKILRTNIRTESLDQCLHIVQWAAEEGIRMAQPVTDLENRLYSPFSGKVASVFPFYPGGYFSGMEKELAEIAKELGRAHRLLALYTGATTHLPVASTLARFQDSAFILHVLSEVRQMLEKKSGRGLSKTDRMVFSVLSRHQHAFLATVMQVEESAALLPRQLIHGDLHPHNCLFDSGELSVILDFDTLSCEQRVKDISFSLHAFARQFIILNRVSAGSYVEELQRIIRIFLRSYLLQNNLENRELESIPVYMRHRVISGLAICIYEYYMATEDERTDSKSVTAEKTRYRIHHWDEMQLMEAVLGRTGFISGE